MEINQMFKKFEEIKNALGTNDKTKLLEKLFKESEEAIEFIRLVYNDEVYGISKRTIEKALNYDKSFTYSDLGELAEKCCEPNFDLLKENNIKFITSGQITELVDTVGKLSGNDLIKYLKQVYDLNYSLGAKYITYMLIHNLHNGLSLRSISRVLVKLGRREIETFEVQLCDKLAPEKFGSLTYPLIAEIKYDGLRIVAEKKGDVVKLTTRQGKDASKYLPEIVEDLKKFKYDFIFDGEVCADEFSTIQQRIGRKSDNLESIESLRYVVFDILKYIDEDLKEKSQLNRHKLLISLWKEFDIDKTIEISKYYICNQERALKDFYDIAVNNGEEGIIIKDMSKSYVDGSRKNWFKVKPIFENTFEMVGFEYGTGRFKDTVGAIKISNGLIKADVGSGLTDNDRQYLLPFLTKAIRKRMFVDIQYQEVTKNKQGGYSLRFPRFLKIRDDKDKADEVKLPN